MASVTFPRKPRPTDLPLPAPLEPMIARVAIASTPPGASVEIDGAQVGTTPCTVEVALDREVRPIVLRLAGHRDHVGDLRITDTLSYRATLAPTSRRWPLVLLAIAVLVIALLVSRSAF